MIKTLRLSLLSLFAVLCGTMFADTYTHEFVKDEITASGTVTLSDVDWDISACDYFGWDNQNGKGFQFGSSTKPCTTLKVSTNGIEGTITEIKVTTSGAKDIAGTLDITVGGAAFGEQYTLTKTSTEVTFTGSASGEIALNYAQTSTKAIYIKSIAVTYTTQSQPTVNYYVVGNMTNWGVNDDYKMTLNEKAEVEEYVYSMALTTASQFKIVKKDGDNLTWYPDGMGNNYGENGEINADGNYDIYFRPNANGGDDWFYGCIYVALNEESALMLEAKALAEDAEAIAVGKLIDAIAAAEESGDETALQAAVDQFKADNADSGINLTAKVGTAKDKWIGAGGTAGSVTTSTGTTTPLAELYSSAGAGTKMSQTITGLENGLYRVKVFATSHNARGEDGATLNGTSTEVAYVFATSGDITNKKWITASGVTPGFLDGEQTNPYTIDDIEVANGELTIGLTVEQEKQTGWHTIQIYSLEKITTAKVAYAAVKANMTEVIATAKALTGEEGQEELAAAIEAAEAALVSNKLNITELEAEVAKLNAAIIAFKKANAIIPEGTYYLMSTASEDMKFMAAGKTWGTRGTVNGEGLDLNFIYNTDNATYIIDTNVDNGNNRHFLGDNLYMDSPAFAWTIEGDYVFTISGMFDGVKKYIGIDDDGNLTYRETETDDTKWAFVQAELLKEYRLGTLEQAYLNNGIDATFLLQDANFNNHDLRVKAWTVSTDCTNKNLGGGANETHFNACAESYHSTFTISQAIEGAPAGLYKMTAQGFYRQDKTDNNEEITEPTPVFFIGDKTAEIPAKTGTENNMGDAGNSFLEGNYTIEPIEFVYDGESDFVVGIKNETAKFQWIIWDNIRLTYYGDPDAPQPVDVPATATIENDWTLDGVSYDPYWEEEELIQAPTSVAFDGDDIYVKGLALYFEDAWIKGTIANGKAVFANSQLVGKDEYGSEFLVGAKENEDEDIEATENIVFTYDATNHKLTLETPYILETGDETGLSEDDLYYVWYDVDIFKGEPATPEVVTPPAELKAEDYIFSYYKYVESEVEARASEEGEASGTYEEGARDIKIGFVGNDVYVQGLCDYLPEAWIKGSIANGNATFATGQYFGGYTYTWGEKDYTNDMYFVGYGQNGMGDMEMTYDAQTGKFESEQVIIINAYPHKAIYDYEVYLLPIFEKKEADAIKTIENNEAKMTIYNLNGQKLEKAQKGLNIINGKVMIRK